MDQNKREKKAYVKTVKYPLFGQCTSEELSPDHLLIRGGTPRDPKG